MSREAEISVAVSELFPGFRFSPTDVELISYYLRRKIAGDESSVSVIAEVEIYNFEPWDLPDQSILKSETEWFFFCARGRKYPHGLQSRRATEQGYWKATGKERSVKSGSQVVGTKRTLVFHVGRAPRSERTEWIMHEYCMSGAPQDALVVCRLRRNCDFQASSSQRQTQDSECEDHFNMPNDGPHQTDGASEGDNKNSESSSASESGHKPSKGTEVESSKDSGKTRFSDPPYEDCEVKEEEEGGGEDCYAEIMDDNIVELDEASLRARRRGEEPSYEARRASQALRSNLQKAIYTEAAGDNCGLKEEPKGITQRFLCFRIKNMNPWRSQDSVLMKNIVSWSLKDVFGVFLVLLALLVSVFFTVFLAKGPEM